MKFATAIDRFLDHHRQQNHSTHTIAAYERDLVGVLAHIADLQGVDTGDTKRDTDRGRAAAGQIDIGQVDADIIEQAFGRFATRRDGKPFDRQAASTIRAQNTWTSLFDHATERDWWTLANPMRRVARPKPPDHQPRALQLADPDGTQDETIAAILAVTDQAGIAPDHPRSRAWPERDVALVWLFATSAARLGEILGSSDWKPEHGVGPVGREGAPTSGHRTVPPLLNGRLTRQADGDGFLTVFGKGGKQRTLPVYPAVRDVIDEYLAERNRRLGAATGKRDRPMFVDVDGAPLRRQSFQQMLSRWYRQAGVIPPQGALVHALRHTAAIRLLRNGGAINELQALLGHASLTSTSGYLKVAGETLQDLVASDPLTQQLRRDRASS